MSWNDVKFTRASLAREERINDSPFIKYVMSRRIPKHYQLFFFFSFFLIIFRFKRSMLPTFLSIKTVTLLFFANKSLDYLGETRSKFSSKLWGIETLKVRKYEAREIFRFNLYYFLFLYCYKKFIVIFWLDSNLFLKSKILIILWYFYLLQIFMDHMFYNLSDFKNLKTQKKNNDLNSIKNDYI